MKPQIIAAAFALGVTSPALADTFVLVHGAFQSAAVWGEVAQQLRSEGHEVALVELPGRDAQGEAARAVTLQDYIDTTRAAVAAAAER